MAKASNVRVELQSGTDRTVFATWNWDEKHTDYYVTRWYYSTGDDVWFMGSDTTATVKQSIYSAPSNANGVKFVLKPVAKKHKVNKKDVAYWTASWSTAVKYSFSSNPPVTPSIPTVSIDQFVLTAEVDDYNDLNDCIEFYVVRNHEDNAVIETVTSGIAQKVTNHASFSCNIEAGNTYKVRCRAIRGEEKSEWSEYSQSAETIPGTPSAIVSCRALSSTSARISWDGVRNAASYNVEYTTNKDWFDASNQVQSMSVESSVCYAEITGLNSGEEWFFRVQAVNEQGKSGWCSPASIVIGKAPASPTTWSSTTTAIVGEEVTLYWVHNSEDNSSQICAELELTVSGTSSIITIQNSTDENEKDKTSFFTLATSSYKEGVKIQWRVRTKGIVDEYGEWSIQRSIDIYAPPVLELTVTDAGGASDRIKSFPISISAKCGPSTQSPMGYFLTVVSNEAYQTNDYTGQVKWINPEEQIYSKHFSTTSNPLSFILSAGDLTLENNVTYTVKCVVSMNSGLTAEAAVSFLVAWEDKRYEPNAEIGIDIESAIAYIRPYCEDESGNLLSDIVLSVYRREFDGSFTELANKLENQNTYITDPHPALDYARYRIVGISKSTGVVSYYDVPGYPIGEDAVIIQWNEEWQNFDGDYVDETERPPWSGSLLKLFYNIDISDKYDQDMVMAKYIGRKHPVSYYGTQVGHTSVWNMEVIKDDKETLFALRRLAEWPGDVYVREPSGSGYWANVKVSFSQKHCELTIPVTLDVARVEGGA